MLQVNNHLNWVFWEKNSIALHVLIDWFKQHLVIIAEQRYKIPHPLTKITNKLYNQPISSLPFYRQCRQCIFVYPNNNSLTLYSWRSHPANVYGGRSAREPLVASRRSSPSVARWRPHRWEQTRRHSEKGKRARVMHDVPLTDIRILLRNVMFCWFFHCCLIYLLVLIDCWVLGWIFK